MLGKSQLCAGFNRRIFQVSVGFLPVAFRAFQKFAVPRNRIFAISEWYFD